MSQKTIGLMDVVHVPPVKNRKKQTNTDNDNRGLSHLQHKYHGGESSPMYLMINSKNSRAESNITL